MLCHNLIVANRTNCGIFISSMEEQEIPRSTKYYDFAVMSTALMAILLVGLSFILLTGTRKIIGDVDITTFGWIIRGGIVLLAILAVYATMENYRNKRYSFSGNRIIIRTRGFGPFAQEKTIIVYLDPRRLKAATLNQSPIDRQFNVGTIYIETDNYSGRHSLALEHLDNPQQVLEAINNYLYKTETAQANQQQQMN